MDLEARVDQEAALQWPGWHAPPEQQPAETPHDRLRVHRGFRSRILPDARDLIVYVPPGYDDEPNRQYPVLYLNDGQNLFDPATSYIKGRTWMVREHADAAIEAGEAIDLAQLINAEVQAEIAAAFQRTGWGNIVGARELLGEKYDYGLLRIYRAARSGSTARP